MSATMTVMRRASRAATCDDVPLVVDLDGTLLRSDLLLETALQYLRGNPLRLLRLLCWLAQGKAILKDRLACATVLDVTVLPYDPDVLAMVERHKADGRRLVLATASNDALAQRVSRHVGLFDEVLGSSAGLNLSARHKKAALVARYGERGFDYAGNARDDLPVWHSARRAIVVNSSSGVERSARKHGNVAEVIRTRRDTVVDWCKALRCHQWLKNLLVFVPLAAAHAVTDVGLIGKALVAFTTFSLCASSAYVLNDLLDLADDRQHPTKRSRPFAAGRLPITSGLIAVPALLAAALGIALAALPPEFSLVLGAYYALTVAYTFALKRVMVLDVVVLALLYTVRLVAGAEATDLALSFWMLAFAMFMFLSLALVKRDAELRQLRLAGDTEQVRGRGYYTTDRDMIASLGGASGYTAVLVMALYINDANVWALYGNPRLIWLACPLLLFWITRLWILANRGQMHDDPVVFAIRDKVSLAVGALCALVFWAAR